MPPVDLRAVCLVRAIVLTCIDVDGSDEELLWLSKIVGRDDVWMDEKESRKKWEGGNICRCLQLASDQ